MLKMTFTKRPVQEIAPWMTMVTPELVLDKDGSLLTVFEFEGIDADTPIRATSAPRATTSITHAGTSITASRRGGGSHTDG